MPIPAETQDGILRQYYYPFWYILKLNKNRARKRRVGGESFTAVARPGSDCLLGIDERILELLEFDQRKRFPDGELFQRMQSVLGEGYDHRAETRSTFVNINGVLTEVGRSWLEL